MRQRGNEEREREERSEPAHPESFESPEDSTLGELSELLEGETVDGDLNGAPALAGIEESAGWEAADAVDALDASAESAGDRRHSTTEILEWLVAERREVLLERCGEAAEVGLGPLFEAVAAATGSEAGAVPLVADSDQLRERLAQLDAALGELEAALAAPERQARTRQGDSE